jgi:hypothetical protein
MSVPKEKQCPKCGSETWIDLDDYSWFERCLECGYTIRFEGVKYENGVEVLVVSTHDGPVAQPVTSRATRLKNLIGDRVEEARILILSQLSRGALTKRMLRIRLRQEGIFKPAFEYAIRQLRESGTIKILKSAGKRRHNKFILWNFVARNFPPT